jgi:hypothetical protein
MTGRMIPKRLFRFFEKRCHAEEFISGRIRLGNINIYKCIENNALRDESEGTSSIVWNQRAPEYIIDKKTLNIVGKKISSTEKIKSEGTLINPIYLLCTSGHRANKVKIASKLNKNYLVEINDPSGLLDLFKQCWAKNPYSVNGDVEFKKVRYDRGNLVKPNKYLIEPFDIIYTQKSPDSKDEYEYRFIFWCQNNPNIIHDNYIYLVIDTGNNVIRKNIRLLIANA